MLSASSSKLVNALSNKYQEYIKSKNSILKISDKDNDEIKAYKLAASHLGEAIDAHALSTFSPEQLLDLINNLHRIVAPPVYKKHSYNSNPGEYRKDEGFVMRHPKRDAYTFPSNYGIIFQTIANDIRYGKKVAFDYLIGYYKLFIVPSKNAEAIQKFGSQLKVVANTKGVPFVKAETQGGLTQQQKDALDIVYKVFIPYQDIDAAMKQFAKDFLDDIRSDKKDIYEIFATHYLKYINIHPHQDCNGRIINMVLNAFLWSKKILPIMIIDEKARLMADYKYARVNPQVVELKEYLKTQGKTFSLSESLQHSSPCFIFHLLHSQQTQNKIDNVPVVISADYNQLLNQANSQLPTLIRPITKSSLFFATESINAFDEIAEKDARDQFIPKCM